MSAVSDRTLRAEIRWAAARAFTDPLRLRLLFARGPRDVRALARFLGTVVPSARRAIAALETRASGIPDAGLRSKARQGLRAKAYHIAGAAAFGTFLPRGARDAYVGIVAPLETIYDFLDTVGDSEPVPAPDASRKMHESLADALVPEREPGAYFLPGAPDDGGFLRAAVSAVRERLHGIPAAASLGARFGQAAQLYAETQTLKHLAPGQREQACRTAFAAAAAAHDVRWYEYAAGAGSQFHVYAPLFLALAGSSAEAAHAAYDAYFPEAAAIHVLLDAFIDRAEDRAAGELNWIDCFQSEADFEERFAALLRRAAEKVAALDRPAAHDFTLRLMLTFYLTHPKVWQQRLQIPARRLLRIAAAETT